METVRVADWLMLASENTGVPVSPVLGEVEAELLFYALKGLTLDDQAVPLFFLQFDWPEVYYSSEFFATLFGFVVDDVMFPYFAHVLRTSDMMACSEKARLVNIAWDRIGLDAEVLA